jgi:hypothetical protein
MGLSSASRVAAAYACLMLAWTVTVPPFSAPDEWSHYLRALGIAHGTLLGEHVDGFHDANLTPAQEAWVAQTVRWTEVPPGMAPDGFACNAFRPMLSASCANQVPPPPRETARRLTVNGTYQPAAYLLPALALRAASGPVSGLIVARLASALACFALLAAAAWVLRPDLTGTIVAVTPMALFIGSALNPSGLEIAGAVALTAGLLAVGRGNASGAPWWVAAAGGAGLCLSRSLGPIWLALIGVECLAMTPTGLLWSEIRLAAALNRAWEAAYGPHLSGVRTERIAVALWQSLRSLPRWFREQVGVYQYLDAPMPGFAYWIWAGAVAVLVFAALRVAARRERFALAISIAAALAVPVLLEAFAMRPIGWAVQGRHVMPLSVAVPIIAGEILVRNRRTLPRIGGAIAVLCAAVHLVGIYSDGRRSAVGMAGSWLFPLDPQWSPLLGWWPWLFVAAAGGAFMAMVRPHPT